MTAWFRAAAALLALAVIAAAGCDTWAEPWVDCGKCSCGTSRARHSPATDEAGRRYCTTCDEYI
jgi:hypothetical protein